MADTSLNENRIGLLIWKISNLWQSKVRVILKSSNISFNEYLIIESIYKLQLFNNNIRQQDISNASSLDRSVVSIKIPKLLKKNLILKISPQDRRSDRIILTSSGELVIKNLINDIQKQEDDIFKKLDLEIFNFTNSLKLILGKKIRIKAKLND
ncbi:hypothetical protein OA492_01740 [Pelagibacteraceae bacterium]|nr:hypothetical protein [Pelagibacteraceae bacterium]